MIGRPPQQSRARIRRRGPSRVCFGPDGIGAGARRSRGTPADEEVEKIVLMGE